MAYQTDPSPVNVYNGNIDPYQVNVRYTGDGATQLMGFDDRYLDAFGRLRVSSGTSEIEIGFAYDLSPSFVEPITATNGTVTHDPAKSSAILTVSTDDGSLAAVQTYRFAPYQRGRSQFTKQTGVMGVAVENVVRRMGYFETNDGVYLEQNGTTDVAVVMRSSVTGSIVNTRVAQASWNLDRLDGTGPSGKTLDLSKGMILASDWSWLGTGRCRIGFIIGGDLIWVHAFRFANVSAVQPYTATAALPLRWEIGNSGASAGATLQAICGDVESEGGTLRPASSSFSACNTANIATSTTRAALLAFRPAAVYPAGGKINRQTIIPGDISIISTGADVLVEVFYLPTLTGGSWVLADATSGVEVNLGATISAPGILIDSFFVPSGSGQQAGSSHDALSSYYPITLDAAGANPRAMLIAATTTTGAGTARCAVSWGEVR